MITRTHLGRFAWLLGIFLLAGTVVGAGWFLHQPAVGNGPAGGNSSETILGVIGLGQVDIEPGITYLHPVQAGRVTHIFIKEGDLVKQGERLLSVDNTIASQRLAQAEAELAAVKHELNDAQDRLPREQQQEIDIQQHKLRAAENELEAAQKWLDYRKRLFKNKVLEENYVIESELRLKAAEVTVKAQQTALQKAKDFNPKATIDRLREQVRAKEAQSEQARHVLDECDLYAPVDGTVLRLFATLGETLSAKPKTAAVHFCPNLSRIIRVEILQEWASKVRLDQLASIEDDTRNGAKWEGKVARISDWFTQRRSVLQEPFQFNDVRTLECIVYLDRNRRMQTEPLRIGQRVRVMFKQ